MINWLWWLLAIIALIIEIATPGNIICIWFTFGGVSAGILQLLKLGFFWQLGGFLIVSFLSLFILRPLIIVNLQGNTIATNIDRLIGKVASLDAPCSSETWGTVRLNGQDWACISKKDTTLPQGSRIRVIAIEGVKLIVERIEEDKNNG